MQRGKLNVRNSPNMGFSGHFTYFTVEIRFGRFCLQWKFGLVLFTYGSLRLEIRFCLFYLQFPPSGNWVRSFLLTVPPP